VRVYSVRASTDTPVPGTSYNPTGPKMTTLLCATSMAYTPPASVRQCLNNSWLFAAGPSELAGILGWLTGGETISTRRNTKHSRENEKNQTVDHRRAASSLRCSTRRNLGDRHWECVARDYRRRSQCRESLYSTRPFDANCSGVARSSLWGETRFRVTYMWKSYQLSRADHVMAEAARRAAARRATSAMNPRVIVVLSTGLAQFSRFREHHEKLLHRVHDDWSWPQPWIDDFVNETSRLFDLFSPRDASASCVAFRAQNIAARHTNHSEPRHHPSAVNGIHHWFNRMSIALARARGLAVVDYTNYTMSTKALDHSADGRGSINIRRADALEGDVFHGYPSSRLGPLFLRELANACCGTLLLAK
jgi:hypothetical protein